MRSKVIGYSGFQYFEKTSNVEILFGYFKEFWSGGLATEAGNACLRYGFEELSFEKVFAATHPENTASQYVLEKLGMNFEDRSKYYLMDSVIYVAERKNFSPKKDFYKLKFRTEEKFPAIRHQSSCVE